MPGRDNAVSQAVLADQVAAPNGNSPGLSLQVMADLSASIGNLTAAVQAQQDQTRKLWAAIRPLTNIVIPQITTSTGQADYPELLSPRTGYWWEVKLAGATTFTAGSVNLYLDGVQDSNLVGAFTSAGYLTYSGQQLLYNWNSRLIFKAISTTGNVSPSLSVIEIRDDALPAYLI